jgi:ketosteroid isomerase-like protein
MPRTARETVEAFLSSVTERTKLIDFYAEDVVIERPFAPAGLRRTEGVEVLRQGIAQAGDLYALEKLDNVVLHETSDPEVIIAEYDVHCRVVAAQKSFVASFIMVLRIRDGLIVHSRDYNNPLTSAAALGTTPDQLAAMLLDEEHG